MARIMNLGNETDIKWIFNLTFPVGTGRANAEDDVMLIQHALNTLLVQFEIKDAKGNLIKSYLKRDGIFGPKTAEAILGYQRSAKARGKQLVADGFVDPATQTGWTTHSNVQYTIVHLNRDHRNTYGKMMDETDFPEKLRKALLKSGTL